MTTQVDQNREDDEGRISQDTATPTAGANQADTLSETAAHFIKRTSLIDKLEFLQGYIPQSYFDKPQQAFIEGLYEELQDYIDELKATTEEAI